MWLGSRDILILGVLAAWRCESIFRCRNQKGAPVAASAVAAVFWASSCAWQNGDSWDLGHVSSPEDAPLSSALLSRVAPDLNPGAGRVMTHVCLGVVALLVPAMVFAEAASILNRLRSSTPSNVHAWALGMVCLVTVWGFVEAMVVSPAVRHVEIQLERLPAEFDGVRVAHLSDLHVGATHGRRAVEAAAGAALREGFDLLAVTGDVAEGAPPREPSKSGLAPLARLAEHASLGSFWVHGNHDHAHYREELTRHLAELGVARLSDSHVLLHRGNASLVLGGTDDFQSGGSVAAAFDRAPAGMERLLLAHQPNHASAAADASVGLVLSGHTHGAQIAPLLYPVISACNDRRVHGLSRARDTQVYVSAGLGQWGPPLRMLAPPELTIVTLRRRPETSSAGDEEDGEVFSLRYRA